MELIVVLAACFTLLFIVEVFLGGALPETEPGCTTTVRGRMNMGAFFGQALPLSAAGIGLPMSIQHTWAIALVAGAALLHVVVCRIMRVC